MAEPFSKSPKLTSAQWESMHLLYKRADWCGHTRTINALVRKGLARHEKNDRGGYSPVLTHEGLKVLDAAVKEAIR